jgi:hypothetical protein
MGRTRGIDVMNRRIGSTLVAVVLSVSASAVLACDRHADAAEAKDAKAVVATGDAKGCDMPCCAHAKAAADTKSAETIGEKPCAAHDAKGCPKKAAPTVAAKTTEPAKDGASVTPAVDSGTHR